MERTIRHGEPAGASPGNELGALAGALGWGLASVLAVDGLFVLVYLGAFEFPGVFAGFLAMAGVLGASLRGFHACWLRACLGDKEGRRAWEEGRTNLHDPARELLPLPMVLILGVFLGKHGRRPNGPTISDALVFIALPFAAMLMPLVAWGLGAW